MDMRLFLSTFVLIFFAELGDKTQLAAMASAAGGTSRWSVFLGASLALVISTLLAVLIGGVLQELVPVHFIKGAAGILFLVFGVLLLWGASSAPAVATAPAAVSTGKTRPGLLSRVVMETALRFEKAAYADYAALAERVTDRRLRNLLQQLAGEENEHLARVRGLTAEHAVAQPAQPPEPATVPRFLVAGGKLIEEEKALVQAAMKQERAKADFYTALARSAHIPALRKSFLDLAREEEDHFRRLAEVAG